MVKTITVFGSSGATGQIIIDRAIDKGFQVKAFVRNPSKIKVSNEKLSIIQGELSDITAIENAVQGSDAVLSMLGPLGNDKRNAELGNGYENIILAMKKNNVKRLIAMGTASISIPEEKKPFKFRWLVFMVKNIIPGSYKEIRRIGSIVMNSGLDWTLLRISILTSGNEVGKVKIGPYGETKLGLTITRSDLAALFIDQVEDRSFICKAPAVSN